VSKFRIPNPYLLLPLLARAHRHARTLRIVSVNYTIFSVPEPRLAPQAARANLAKSHKSVTQTQHSSLDESNP
jgi:hypothetical protein